MRGLKPLKPLSGRIVNNIIGNKRFGGKNDWDGDGVPNKRDCQPRNTMRQDKIFDFDLADVGGEKRKIKLKMTKDELNDLMEDGHLSKKGFEINLDIR